MLKIENTEVLGWEHAIHGMRNPMNRLRNAGTDHRKFMRMITVYVDLTGPLYWWKEVVKLWPNATILTFWMVVMIPWA